MQNVLRARAQKRSKNVCRTEHIELFGNPNLAPNGAASVARFDVHIIYLKHRKEFSTGFNRTCNNFAKPFDGALIKIKLRKLGQTMYNMGVNRTTPDS